jgi:hypothetical protein
MVATYESESAVQSLNSYSCANDNPITKSDPNGNFAAAAAAPFVLGGGASLSLETLGLSMLVAGGVMGALYLAERSWPTLKSGAPGNYQATQMVSGQGYDPDPRPPLNRPPGRWGGLILTALGTGFAVPSQDWWESEVALSPA